MRDVFDDPPFEMDDPIPSMVTDDVDYSLALVAAVHRDVQDVTPVDQSLLVRGECLVLVGGLLRQAKQPAPQPVDHACSIEQTCALLATEHVHRGDVNAGCLKIFSR